MTLLISHIPKTAGTSLRKIVSSLNPDTVWAYNRELSLLNPNFEFINTFKRSPTPSVLMGHFSYGVHRFLNITPKYATVLRNPIDRIISLYYYQTSLADSDFFKHFQNGLSLYDFVSQGLTEMTNNHACRIIAGIPPDAGMLINQRWILDLAVHNIRRHYALVGILENINDFLFSLGNLLGWKNIDFPLENETKLKSNNLDDRTRDCIVENNYLDIELYKYILDGCHIN